MKNNTDELLNKIERYRSDANINRMKKYQNSPEKYFEEEKNMAFYSKLIERDIVKPYLKNKELGIKPTKNLMIFNTVYTLLGGSVAVSSIVRMILEPNIFSGVAIGLGLVSSVLGLTFLVKNHKKIYKVANEIKEFKNEWDLMKNNPEYLQDFMNCNNVHIQNGVNVDGDNIEDSLTAVTSNFNEIISPLNEEWLF